MRRRFLNLRLLCWPDFVGSSFSSGGTSSSLIFAVRFVLAIVGKGWMVTPPAGFGPAGALNFICHGYPFLFLAWIAGLPSRSDC